MSKVDLVRRPMPKQEPVERVRNFDEVALGYTPELAREEAARCLRCKKPGCVDGCPVGIDIPGFIGSVADGDFGAAIRTVKQTNALPAVCGRVPPAGGQREAQPRAGQEGRPTWRSARLERFVADREAQEGPARGTHAPRRRRTVAASPWRAPARPASPRLGPGPARSAITMFEALDAAGGCSPAGIPEFRLPKSDRASRGQDPTRRSLGCSSPRLPIVVGKTNKTIHRLQESFDAVFLRQAPACRGSSRSPART